MAAIAVAAAGCGGDREPSRDPSRDPNAAPATRPAPATATAPRLPVSSRPNVAPRAITLHDQLFSVERRWPGIAIADRLAIDEHGGGRIVRGGGGGGLRIERCRFTASEMAGWRADLARLGPDRPTEASHQRNPATYLINYQSRQRVVQSGAMPKRYAPLARRIVQLLYRGGKGCHTVYAQRLHSHSVEPG